MNALIGYTGFVGSNLAAQHSFPALFHSRNIEEMRGRTFDRVVCAGVQAKKWWANQNPEADWAGIQRLLDVLGSIQTGKFVLISTVDVYPRPVGVTESTAISGDNHVYGRHRRQVEEFVEERFRDHHVLRLPGLFGDGLKKNVIFDLLHDNCLPDINPEGVYQYYYLKHLWTDIERCIAEGLPLLNLAAEPIKTADIIAAYFPHQRDRVGPAIPFTVNYDMRSDYGALWKTNAPGYLYDRATVLREIGEFVAGQQTG